MYSLIRGTTISIQTEIFVKVNAVRKTGDKLMTNSERLLSSFSEDFFYKEFVYADLKFTPEGGTEIELAYLIIDLEDVVLAIQLKERNLKNRTQDKNVEEK